MIGLSTGILKQKPVKKKWKAYIAEKLDPVEAIIYN